MKKIKQKHKKKIVVVMPLYRTKKKCITLIKATLNYADLIICIDDHCPELSGTLVEEKFSDTQKVKVVFNELNLGVGGASKKGFELALMEHADIIIKLDSDWQIPYL